MVLKRLSIALIILSLSFPSTIWGQVKKGDRKKQDPATTIPKTSADFQLDKQAWVPYTNQDFDTIEEVTYLTRHKGAKYLYKIASLKNGGLVLVDYVHKRVLKFAIPAQSVSISKNYVFITADQIGKFPGFFMLRLIDIHMYGSQTPASPVPLYFIPIDARGKEKMKNLIRVAVTHDDLQKELEIFMVLNDGNHTITKLLFKEVEQVLKIQMIYLALHQASINPNLKALNALIVKFKKDFAKFYSDLHKALKTAGGKKAVNFLNPDMKSIDWASSTPTDLAKAFKQTEKNPKLVKIKMKFSQRMADLIEAFYVSYDGIMKRTQFSFLVVKQKTRMSDDLVQKMIKGSKGSLAHKDQLAYEKRLKEDTNSALKTYAGIGAATLFLFFGLPRLLKMPASEMLAKWNKVHYFYLTKPLSIFTRWRVGAPQVYKGVNITGEQFKRATWQVLADTGTVVAAELMTRPLFRKIGQPDYQQAIMVNEPFTKIHTLWWHKNFLYHVLANQILGTFGVAATLAIAEKELNEVIKKFIVDTKLEAQIAKGMASGKFAFTDQQRRILFNDLIQKDMKQIQVTTAEHLKQKGAGSKLSSILTPQQLMEIRESWLNKIQELIAKEKAGFQFSPTTRQEVGAILSAKIVSVAQTHLDDQTKNLSKRVGIFKKIFLAMGAGMRWTSTKMLGAKFTDSAAGLAKKTWAVWLTLFEPAVWNMILVQSPIRGSFNGSMFLFGRMVSLAFLTPFYLGSYEWTKKRVGIRGGRGEFLFGIGYGIVTSFVYQWLFINGYEKPMLGTKYDLEFVKYYQHYFGDGRPLDDPELLRKKREKYEKKDKK